MPQRPTSRGLKTKPVVIPDFFVGGQTKNKFGGLVTVLADPRSVTPGVYVDGKNWLTGQLQDHVELRGGTLLMGTGNSGTGKITGSGVGIRPDGTEVWFRSRGRKVEYYNTASAAWVEVGSNLLPLAASGEDVSFQAYDGLAGAFMFVSSPNSSIYKIPLANPGSAVDQVSTTYRGRILIAQNRMHLWRRLTLATGFKDFTGHYLSRVDKALLSDFTTVTAESVGTGDGVTKTFTGTLSARTGKRTVFGQTLTDGSETFLDDRNGVLTGSAGGTGTINYATGAYSVTFAVAPANLAAITTTYQWEDSTSTGICDFTYTSPVRLNGEGDYFRQDDGGDFQLSLPFNSVYYDIHSLKAWILDLTSNDTVATNLPWRSRLGLPYWRSAFANGDGITLLDYSEKNNPKVRRLQYNIADQVVPKDLSDVLDLNPYEFTYAVMFEFGNYDILCCQKKTLGTAEAYNSVMFVRNKTSELWDKLEYFVSVLSVYNGELYAGDFISNNSFKLFSGSDDEGYIIDNFITFGQHELGIKALKKTNYFEVEGYISPSQVLEIWLAYDSTESVKVGEIRGDGAYVDLSMGAVIGGGKIGSDVIGSSGAESNAFHFVRRFKISSPIYEVVQPTFKATNIGAISIHAYGFVDNRYKGRHKSQVYDS